MHKDRKQFNNMKNSVIKIQKCWREYLQRSKVKKEDNISDISQNVKLECSDENSNVNILLIIKEKIIKIRKIIKKIKIKNLIKENKIYIFNII